MYKAEGSLSTEVDMQMDLVEELSPFCVYIVRFQFPFGQCWTEYFTFDDVGFCDLTLDDRVGFLPPGWGCG